MGYTNANREQAKILSKRYSEIDTKYRNKTFGVKDFIREFDNCIQPASFPQYLKKFVRTNYGSRLKGKETENYVDFLKAEFERNGVKKGSFDGGTTVRGAIESWLQESDNDDGNKVKRDSILLLSLGLKLSVDQMTEMFNKGIRQTGINPHNPREAICYYCLNCSFDYPYEKYCELWEKYMHSNPGGKYEQTEYTADIYTRLSEIKTDDELLGFLAETCSQEKCAKFSKTAREEYLKLFDRVKVPAVVIYNKEIIERQKALGEKTSSDGWPPEKMTPNALQKLLYNGSLDDNNNVLSNYHVLNNAKKFACIHFRKDDYAKIKNNTKTVTRYDLITMSFLLHACTAKADPSAWKQTHEYKKEPNVEKKNVICEKFENDTNAILEKCKFMKLYEGSPYESFLILCMLTGDPFQTYTDLMSNSYNSRSRKSVKKSKER